MPSASAITITLASGAVVFTPVKASPERSILLNRTSTISAGYKEMVVGFSGHTQSRGTDKINLRLNVPYEYTNSDGEQQVDHIMRFSGEWIVHKDIPEAARQEFEELVRLSLQNAVLKGYIADLDPIYG